MCDSEWYHFIAKRKFCAQNRSKSLAKDILPLSWILISSHQGLYIPPPHTHTHYNAAFTTSTHSKCVGATQIVSILISTYTSFTACALYPSYWARMGLFQQLDKHDSVSWKNRAWRHGVFVQHLHNSRSLWSLTLNQRLLSAVRTTAAAEFSIPL